MPVANLAFSLFALSSGVVEAAPMDSERFKVSIVYRSSASPLEQADAQIALMQAAKKLCKGKGQPVSEGTLYLDGVGPDAKGHKKLRLSEIYTCVAKAKN